MFLDGSATNLRVPHPPGFPVSLVGSMKLHAAFLIESRTRCHGWGRAIGNPGSFALFAKGGIPRISIRTVAYRYARLTNLVRKSVIAFSGQPRASLFPDSSAAFLNFQALQESWLLGSDLVNGPA
jgi:hypothetical protein